ncbi:hypothetical protein Aduo_009679 [Ancylostoma duodenale]
MANPDQNPDPKRNPVPPADDDTVHLRKEDFEELLSQLGMHVPPCSSSIPQFSSNIPMSSSNMPSSSSKPKFTKPGLSRQFDFNSEILSILSPLLLKVIQLLTQRNELLAVADSDPDVWEFYDKHFQPIHQPVPYPNQGMQSSSFAPPPYPGPFVPQQSMQRNLKPMCFNCGRFGHLRNQCLFPSTGK